MEVHGVHGQIAPISTASRAPQGLVTHDTSVSPKRNQRVYRGPLLVSVSILKRYATPTGVIIIGSRNTTRKKRRPGICCTTRRARPSASRYWTDTSTET